MPKKKERTNRERIARLAAAGLTQRDISALTGQPKTTIHRRLQALKRDPDYIGYCQNKADVMEMIQYQILSATDQDAIKSMICKRGMTDVGILEDKIRTIRGQATDITLSQIRGLLAHIDVHLPTAHAPEIESDVASDMASTPTMPIDDIRVSISDNLVLDMQHGENIED